MQNEPQLSAEIEIVTKFRQFLADWDYAHITRKVPVEESRQMCDEFALTLATALEEQRNQGLKDALVLAYDLADEKGTLNYGKLHRQVELALLTQQEDTTL